MAEGIRKELKSKGISFNSEKAILKNNLPGERQDAGRERGTSRNDAEGARPEAALRESVVGLVQKIEGFHSEVEGCAFRIEGKVFVQPKIELVEGVEADRVATCTTVRVVG